MVDIKITVDLPDALYRLARIRAAERGTTPRALLIESLEESLRSNAALRRSLPTRGRFAPDERGWPVLRRATGDRTTITDELIDRLREQEGV